MTDDNGPYIPIDDDLFDDIEEDSIRTERQSKSTSSFQNQTGGIYMKGKVIKVGQSAATIGYPDGTFKTVSYKELGFCPEVGSEVELYTNGYEVAYVQNTGRVYHDQGDKKAVNQIVYVLFAIFLGGFGVHKFYAGKIGMGILYFLFSWSFISELIGIIEGLAAIGKKADSDGNILV